MQQEIFWSTRDETRGEWRRLHNEELHDGYVSPDIRVIYSRRLRWPGHVARTYMEERRGGNRVFLERLKDRRSLGRGKGDWRIILKWNLKK